MKPNVFGYALSCCLLVLGACATHSHALYSTDKIPILSQDTTAKMDELSSAGADEVYELVKKNLTRLQEVLKLTGKDVPPHDKDRAQQITGLFKEMWEDYKEVASKAGPIELNMTQKLQELKALLTEPNNIIEDLEKELGGLKRELSTGIQEEDEARRAIREQSLQVQIAFLDGELKTWRTFREFQINTAKKAEDMRKMVSNLMLILAENAKIYEKAYRFALANQQYDQAMRTMGGEYDKIREITTKLLDSWGMLLKAVDEIMKKYATNAN